MCWRCSVPRCTNAVAVLALCSSVQTGQAVRTVALPCSVRRCTDASDSCQDSFQRAYSGSGASRCLSLLSCLICLSTPTAV
jgi:hypothetical protein